jgi:UDP-2,3-diacylglucosamine hydrolase
LADSGIKITLFKGNHDMWMFGYLKEEIGVEIIDNEKIVTWGGQRFFLHHGDGLGPGDRGYKLIKNIFRNKWCQRLFAFIHPFWGMGLAQYLSTKSRLANDINKQPFDEPNEWLLQYCKEKIKTENYDYLIFGHRHLPLDIQLNENSRYINLGEWVNNFTYAEFDGEQLKLKKFE